ncbi:MAG: hypothetical protein ACYTEP_01090 [Planctomycetota bacterium]|jgi:hypothetical protein
MISTLPTLLLAAAPIVAPPAQTAGAEPQILVYDHGNTSYALAVTAANNLYPTSVTVADAGSFNSTLNSQPWDAVLLDCPSTGPSGGWNDLVNYVNNDGVAVLSYWDWDGSANSVLLTPFDVSAPLTFGLSSQTFTDSGTSDVFEGVTMPISDWSSRWSDDGDEFTPINGAIGLGHFGNPAKPTMVLGNDGRTIAIFVLDESGPTWIGDGSGVRLWENMLDEVLNRVPTLEVTDVIPGQFMTLNAGNIGTDSDVVFLVSSLGAGPTVTPFGEIAVTLPWRQTPAFPADASGEFNFTSTLPPGASGSTFYMQSVVFKADATTELTNPLEVPIP